MAGRHAAQGGSPSAAPTGMTERTSHALKIEERVVVQVARAQGYAALGYALRTTATTLTAGNNSGCWQLHSGQLHPRHGQKVSRACGRRGCQFAPLCRPAQAAQESDERGQEPDVEESEGHVVDHRRVAAATCRQVGRTDGSHSSHCSYHCHPCPSTYLKRHTHVRIKTGHVALAQRVMTTLQGAFT